MTTLENIKALADLLQEFQGDTPESHRIAKLLLADVQTLVKRTQPGIGAFKHTAKTDLMLTNRSKRTGHPSRWLIARDGNDVWHTNDYYAVKGEPSARLVPEQAQELPMNGLRQVVRSNETDAQPVSVVGPYKGPLCEVDPFDWVQLTNDVVIDRVYLAYVQSLHPTAILVNKHKLSAVCFQVDGVTVGLVMPVRAKD